MSNNKGQGTQPRRARSVSLSVVNCVVIIIVTMIAIMQLSAAYRAIESYRHMETATQDYIGAQRDAMAFLEGSDCLTAESRYYVLTGEGVHMDRYVEEVEVTRRRDRAVHEIDDILTQTGTYAYLSEALTQSEALAEVELYAMRLAAASRGVPQEALPECIGGVALAQEDAALSAEAQRQRAEALLFGDDYADGKQAILDNVEKSIGALVESARLQQAASSARLNRLLDAQRLLLLGMVVALLAMAFMTYMLVIRPLRRSVGRIRSGEPIPVEGSSEMQFLAQTYNEILDKNTRSTEQLTYSATHDALTGLYNRAAFDATYTGADKGAICMMIVDVDHFKTFNDQYGHDVGDRVLQCVAKVLRESFRSEDFVGRIGGDEFCVMMMHADSSLRQLVTDKIARANQRLKEADDVPSITLSVGVAFGDRPNPQGDIFKDADTALYRVKRAGGDGCAFY